MTQESIAELIKPLKYVSVANGTIVYRPRIPKHARGILPEDSRGFFKPPYRLGSTKDKHSLITHNYDKYRIIFESKLPERAKPIKKTRPMTLVQGVGINDSSKTCDRKIYLTWNSMITRCYSEDYKTKNPTYKDCTLQTEWLRYSVFRDWMIKQDYQGKQLDKDLIKVGNKHYSEDTCTFISPELNTALSIKKDATQNHKYNRSKKLLKMALMMPKEHKFKQFILNHADNLCVNY